MRFCVNCWETKENCECFKSMIADIDDDIADIVLEFNKKNYETLQCCSGHLDGRGCVIFIEFMDDYFTDEQFKNYSLIGLSHKGYKKGERYEIVGLFDFPKIIKVNGKRCYDEESLKEYAKKTLEAREQLRAFVHSLPIIEKDEEDY